MSDERALSLRTELKAWEKQFAADNGGQRPGRDDIKNNADIAAKYREYDGLRRPAKRQESQKSQPAKAQSTPKKKAVPTATPQKTNSQFLMPSLPAGQEEQEEEEQLEPTPAAVRMHLGPTPQKDGHILSLFDDLPSIASSKRRPSRTALGTIEGNISATPSKPSQSASGQVESSPPENLHLNNTPASSSKRFLLDSFVSTPLKRKREDDDAVAHATPSSSAKGLATPAFLRRSSNMLIMDTLAEEAENDEEMKGLNLGRIRQPPFKKRGIVRSLSSIIQGLRKQEDDKLDEELEIMRDMEEADELEAPRPAVQVEDSQVAMPLGPDRALESDEDEEEEPHGGIFRKPWKKKGLKRQTKRVMMRPAPKPKPPSQPLSDHETSDHEEATIAETQIGNAPNDMDSDSDAASTYSDTEAKRKRQLTKTTTTTTTTTSTDPKTDNVVKKAAKKISATAHANFRRLNIKNQNSKAEGRGRFGRR